MNSRAQRRYGDVLLSMGVLVFVLGVLVSVDERVREQASAMVRGFSSSSPGDLGAQVNEMAGVTVDAFWTQSLDHAPLLVFIVAASVLVLAMART